MTESLRCKVLTEKKRTLKSPRLIKMTKLPFKESYVLSTLLLFKWIITPIFKFFKEKLIMRLNYHGWPVDVSGVRHSHLQEISLKGQNIEVT